jgi:hypothetical protein
MIYAYLEGKVPRDDVLKTLVEFYYIFAQVTLNGSIIILGSNNV